MKKYYPLVALILVFLALPLLGNGFWTPTRYDGTTAGIKIQPNDTLLVQDGARAVMARAAIDSLGDVHLYDADGTPNVQVRIYGHAAGLSLGMQTADGADTALVEITAGGGFGSTRGAIIKLAGNEQASIPGDLMLIPGVTGDILLGDNAAGAGDAYLPDRLIDWDNSSYYLDPSGTSPLATVQADAITMAGDIALGAYTVTGAGSRQLDLTSSYDYVGAELQSNSATASGIRFLNSSGVWQGQIYGSTSDAQGFVSSGGSWLSKTNASGYLYANQFIDLGNASYYVDPAGTSPLADPETARAASDANDIPNKTYVDGVPATWAGSGTQTLSDPETSRVATNDNDVPNKLYVDTQIAAAGGVADDWTYQEGNRSTTATATVDLDNIAVDFQEVFVVLSTDIDEAGGVTETDFRAILPSGARGEKVGTAGSGLAFGFHFLGQLHGTSGETAIDTVGNGTVECELNITADTNLIGVKKLTGTECGIGLWYR